MKRSSIKKDFDKVSLIKEIYLVNLTSKRGKLKSDLDILCDQIRAIDINRIKSDSIAKLSEREMMEVEEMVKIILDFE